MRQDRRGRPSRSIPLRSKAPLGGPRITRPALALLLLSACDADFDVARGELGPFRVAALGVERAEDGSLVAAAAVWSGLGLYHEASPALSWTLDGQPLGEGYDVVVPDSGELGLVATSPDGEVREARVDIAAPPPALSVTRSRVDLGDDLSLEARQQATATDVEVSAPKGEAARLSLAFVEEAAEADWSARWMLALGHGTLLEVDALAADVLAEEITWDDGEIVDRDELEPGLFPTLALVLDGAGSNRWVWADAAIGLDLPALRHEGRLLPLSQADGEAVAEAAPGYVAATLVEADGASGVALDEVTVLTTLDLTVQDALSCAPAGQPFRFAWIAEGRCPRPEVLGARVVLEVW